MDDDDTFKAPLGVVPGGLGSTKDPATEYAEEIAFLERLSLFGEPERKPLRGRFSRPGETNPERPTVRPVAARVSWEVADLQPARTEGFNLIREREEMMAKALLDDQAREFERRLFFGEPDRDLGLTGIFNHPANEFIETTTDDGEKVLFVMPRAERMAVKMQMFPEPLDPDPVRFVFGQQLGGFVVRDPIDRIITVTDIYPREPTGPDVEAMLADGWVWTLGRFARDQCPTPEMSCVVTLECGWTPIGSPVFIRTGPEGHPRIGQYRSEAHQLLVDAGEAVEVTTHRWASDGRSGQARLESKFARPPGRFAGYVSARLVSEGRYADRPPTNRKRKRERAKARRAARRAA